MAGGELSKACFHRHPELVSGSIKQGVRSLWGKRNGAVGSSPRNLSAQAQWILKQVQDDVDLKVVQ